MREVIRIKYQYNEVYLLCWWDDENNFGGITSFQDKHLMNRAFRAVYDNKTFANKKAFLAYVNLLKKRAA